MAEYTPEQIYEAMRRADAAGDGEAVKALAAALKGGASKEQILAQAADSNLSVDEAALDANIASREAGGPTNTFVPPKTNIEHLAAGTQNALAGAAQGVAGVYDFPMQAANMLQQGTNALLGAAGGGILDAVGAEGAADWWRGAAGKAGSTLANLPTAAGAIEQISPTPEGMGAARLTSQIAGGLMVPLGPKANPRPMRAPRLAASSGTAEQVVEAGKREGVRVMTSDVVPPRGFTTKMLRTTGERIPIAGTGGQRVAQNEERVEAVRNLAREFGVEGSEEVIDKVADDLAKTRGGKIAALSARKNRVIEGIPGTVETPGAVAEIDRQIAALERLKPAEVGPVIAKLQNWKSALLGQTTRIDTGLLDASGKPIIREIPPERSLRVIEDLRKLVGEAFEDPALAAVKTLGQKAVNKVYAPLREDMGTFIRSRGGDSAFNAWKQSNDELAAMAGELDATAFKGVLNDADTTPENVAKLLFSKKPSDVRRLFANLSFAGQEKARSAVIYEAVRKAGGLEDISPQRFANSLKEFGRTTGIIFGDAAPRIEGIVRLLRATQQASVAAAAPPTGVQNAQILGAGALTAALGPLGGVTAAGIAGTAARLYESAPVRNLLVNLSKTQPGSKAEGATLERIGKALVSQIELQTGRGAANDNARLASNVAAQPNDQQ
jgi:hypothetical protein